MPSLTPEQQSLAASPQAIKLARCLAATASRRKPWLFEELYSSALLGLCVAALAFDPTRDVQFLTFARHRIQGALLDSVRRNRLRGFRRRSIENAPDVLTLTGPLGPDVGEGEGGPMTLLDELIDGCDPVGWELEYEDELNGLCRKLPRQYGRVIRMLYGYAATRTRVATARAIGVIETRVSNIHTLSVGLIRKRLGITAIQERDYV